jgi:hypothetical protein
MRRLVAAFGLLLVACGGNVSGGGSDPDPEGAQEPEDDPAAPSTHAGHEPSNADTELGECKLGPPIYETSGTPCTWLADNRCYVARDMACNCVCPRDRDSQCTSGFEAGPEGRVQVDCY